MERTRVFVRTRGEMTFLEAVMEMMGVWRHLGFSCVDGCVDHSSNPPPAPVWHRLQGACCSGGRDGLQVGMQCFGQFGAAGCATGICSHRGACFREQLLCKALWAGLHMLFGLHFNQLRIKASNLIYRCLIAVFHFLSV